MLAKNLDFSKFQDKQEQVMTWVNYLNSQYNNQNEYHFLVDYSREEMLKISFNKIEEVQDYRSQFIISINKETVVTSQNERRMQKLLTALYRYYKEKEESVHVLNAGFSISLENL